MNNNLVSIVIPMYNGEKTIKKCLKSICNQTYINIEIIVVNDGSTDLSENIIYEIQSMDSRIKLFNKENGGQSSARNFGISKVSGDYICFVDCDDYVDSNMILEMLDYSRKYNLDLIVSGMMFDYVEEGYTKQINFERKEYSFKKNVIGNIIYDSCKNGLIYSPCNKLYKTLLINEYNLEFPTSTEPIEDIFFNCEYIKRIPSIGVLDKAYYHYIKRNVESTVSRYHKNLEKMTILRNKKLGELFNKYNMKKDKHEKWLASEYIGGKANCISNIYKKNSNYTLKMRTRYFKENVLSDKRLIKAIQIVNNDGDYFDKKILIFLQKFKSAYFFRQIYDILFFGRNRFQKLYFLIRKINNKTEEDD